MGNTHPSLLINTSELTREKRPTHAIQSLFENAARGTEVETYMSLPVLTIKCTINERYSRSFKEKFIGRFFQIELCEIQPSEISSLGHCYTHFRPSLSYIVDYKISIPGKIAAQLP